MIVLPFFRKNPGYFGIIFASKSVVHKFVADYVLYVRATESLQHQDLAKASNDWTMVQPNVTRPH